MKERLLLGVAGILCAIMVAALVAPVLTPHIQGSAVPQELLIIEESKRCSAMYGCESDYVYCDAVCAATFYGVTIILGDCCPVGVDVGSCMYCDD